MNRWGSAPWLAAAFVRYLMPCLVPARRVRVIALMLEQFLLRLLLVGRLGGVLGRGSGIGHVVTILAASAG